MRRHFACLVKTDRGDPMYITKRSLPRRTFLRGMGTTLALPLLDAMVPAMATAANTVGSQARFGFVYIPHGVILDQFLPKTEGADFEYRPIMKPVEGFRNQITLISNVAGPPDGGSGHVGAGAAWLTGASAKRTEAEDVRLGV